LLVVVAQLTATQLAMVALVVVRFREDRLLELEPLARVVPVELMVARDLIAVLAVVVRVRPVRLAEMKLVELAEMV
jgi:hypothetical protein